MGTYSVLLIDAQLTEEQQSALRQRVRGCRLESNWDRLSGYGEERLRYGGAAPPVTAADKAFWILDTSLNFGARHWDCLRSTFVDKIRELVPGAAVYLTNDYMLEEHEWTREQWLDIAEGRREEIHPSKVELLTDKAIAAWDSAAAEQRLS